MNISLTEQVQTVLAEALQVPARAGHARTGLRRPAPVGFDGSYGSDDAPGRSIWRRNQRRHHRGLTSVPAICRYIEGQPPCLITDPDSLEFTPALAIPDHLVGEVQSKLAYVDELITLARGHRQQATASPWSCATAGRGRSAAYWKTKCSVWCYHGQRRHPAQGAGAGRLARPPGTLPADPMAELLPRRGQPGSRRYLHPGPAAHPPDQLFRKAFPRSG